MAHLPSRVQLDNLRSEIVELIYKKERKGRHADLALMLGGSRAGLEPSSAAAICCVSTWLGLLRADEAVNQLIVRSWRGACEVLQVALPRRHVIHNLLEAFTTLGWSADGPLVWVSHEHEVVHVMDITEKELVHKLRDTDIFMHVPYDDSIP